MFDFIENEEVRQQAIDAHNASITTIKTELSDEFTQKFDKETQGMKDNMEKLLDEKKTLSEKMATFKDITDPEKALEALRFIEESHDAQLIKDGRVDELIEKRTTHMRQEHETAVEELQKQVKELADGKGKYKGLFQNKVIDDTIREAALKAGIRIEAIPDVLGRGRGVFSLNDTFEVEARDSKGKLVKTDDDMVMTPDIWVTSLKETAPHYWPGSEGAGAGGGGGAGGDDIEAELARLAEKGDMVGYRRLREKQQKQQANA